MKAQDLMTTVVQTVSPRATLKDAAQLLWEHDCGMVPIVDANVVKGVITDRDICIMAQNHDRKLSDLGLEGLLKEEVWSCAADDTAETVMTKMASHSVRRLPVVNGDNELEGVISVDDMARAAMAGKLDLKQVMETIVAVNGTAAATA